MHVMVAPGTDVRALRRQLVSVCDSHSIEQTTIQIEDSTSTLEDGLSMHNGSNNGSEHHGPTPDTPSPSGSESNSVLDHLLPPSFADP
jgi:hypothetical protein